MTKEELQAQLDKEYPDLCTIVRPCLQYHTVFRIMIPLETQCYLDQSENLGHIKSRLLNALEDAKTLIDHDISRIKGELA